MEELKKLLDYIETKNPYGKKGIYLYCKKYPEVLDPVKKFIKERGKVSASDVLEFASKLVKE